jgi:hypothetical protein
MSVPKSKKFQTKIIKERPKNALISEKKSGKNFPVSDSKKRETVLTKSG